MKRDIMLNQNKFSILEWNPCPPVPLLGFTISKQPKCQTQPLTSKPRSTLFRNTLKIVSDSDFFLSVDPGAQHISNNRQICHKSSPTPLTKENLQILPTSSNRSFYISNDQKFERVLLGLPTRRMAGWKLVQAWEEKWEEIGSEKLSK
jgi:hypothetical protein